MTNRETSAQFVPVTAFDLVVFGAAGDLSLRKLIPSLFHRWRDNQIPSNSKIIGASRTAMSTSEFRELALESFKKFHPGETVEASEWQSFSELIHYCELDAVDGGEDWAELRGLLEDSGDKQLVHYLALPPSLYGAVSNNIAAAGLNSAGARIVLEKPIGKDLASAQEINAAVGAVFDEESIFRIDHYLGKETVQNLIVLRFMNSLFEPVWNSNAIAHLPVIFITAQYGTDNGGQHGLQ